MKLMFAGTPAFAAAALGALHQAGHEIALVLTQPDRPAGRGMQVTASAVSILAMQLGLPTAKPATLRDSDLQATLRNASAEIMVVAAYGLILPQAVLDIPRSGCVNIHASLLPRWRGAAPVQRAIQAGDGMTGVSIMHMDVGLDTGPILLTREIPIGRDDTSATLMTKLAALGANAIVQALANYASLVRQPQAAEGVTYAEKLTRSEAPIAWHKTAVEIDRQIRAFDPFPGAETALAGTIFKIWRAHPIPGVGEPGTVLNTGPDGVAVACGQDALLISELQKPGAKRLAAADFLRATTVLAGDHLGP